MYVNIVTVCIAARKDSFHLLLSTPTVCGLSNSVWFCACLLTLLDTNYSRSCSLIFFSLFALQQTFLQKVGCTAKASFRLQRLHLGTKCRVGGERGREREREKEVCKVTGVPPQCQLCNRDRLRWEGHVPSLSVSNTESR